MLPAQTATPTRTPLASSCQAVATWGNGIGSGAGQFVESRCLAVYQNTLYVADLGNNRIKRFTLDGASVPPDLTLGGGLNQPFGLAVDPTGMLYVSEYGTNGGQRILKVNPATDQAAVTVESGFAYYAGLSLDSDGDLYVALDEVNGPEAAAKFRETSPNVWTSVTTLVGALSANGVLALSGGATVYVTDTMDDRVRRYLESPVGSDHYVYDGDPVTFQNGNPPGTTIWPYQLASDANGYFYLSDITQQFNVFDRNWGFMYRCAIGTDLYGIALDGSANVYLGLKGNGSVAKIGAGPLPVATATPTPVPTATPVPCDAQNQTAYLYPTPLQGGLGRFRVVLCRPGTVRVALYNALGDLAGKAEYAGVAGENNFEYDFSNFTRGVYYYLVETDGIRQKPGKFAVTR